MNISATCFTSKEIKALAENHPKKGVRKKEYAIFLEVLILCLIFKN